MNFRVGQKVVCVRASRNPVPTHATDVAPGVVYTVRDVLYWQGEVGIRVDEILNPMHWSGDEYGFLASRFRPIVERKTDISFAHEILRKATKPAPATPVALHHLGTEP